MEHSDAWGRGEPFGAACGREQRFWETLRVEGGVKGQGSKGKEDDEWGGGLKLVSGLVL